MEPHGRLSDRRSDVQPSSRINDLRQTSPRLLKALASATPACRLGPPGLKGSLRRPAPSPSLAPSGHVGGEGVVAAAWAGGGTLQPVGMRGWAASGLGPHGPPGAGPVATAEARGAAASGGRGESPGAWALGTGRRWLSAGPHWASRLLAPCLGGGPAGAGHAHLLRRSVVGGAAPQTAPAQRCEPGRSGALET